jgi:hypothetical protein
MLMKNKTGSILTLLAMFILSACQNDLAKAGEILYVDSKLVDCVGVVPQKCMLVRSNEGDRWEFFYDQISGFQYEAGHSYKLLIKIIKVDNPPQDASSLRYELIEIIEKN